MVMTVAVVADIHANRYALQAFLAWLAGHPAVEQVWNLGDFLQIGPHPAEVADLLLPDARIISIFGNNEQALLQCDPGGFPIDELAHQEWTRAQLGAERLARVAQLPAMRRLTICGRRVLLCHEPPAAQDMRDIDLVCCGHTHRPAYERHGPVTLLNPGSLGFGWGESAHAFSVIEFGEATITVQRHTVAVDRTALKRDYLQRQVPGRERIRSIFLGEA